ncbi:hypothetical protein [Novosphingobium profundi]|uniref:hypothetical protein n=1 Tax=Novosphingobium profundi TaxID=1774954 RepID=UPI001CFEFF43|nr:hypothetical protein [Novosphingobium profundi]
MSTRNTRKAREAARAEKARKEAEARAWFAPKRYGLGSGLPIRWQGWLLYALYFAAIAGCVILFQKDTYGARPGAIGLFLAVSALILPICARRTRGGWRWRWGRTD